MKKSNLLESDYVSLAAEATSWRRHLHRHPELSFQETETTAYIEQQIAALGIPYRKVSPTGLIAFIQGNGRHQKAVALRADIDALPIQEALEPQKDYRSVHAGIMHACGHDYHTANLLGVAHALMRDTTRLEGNVVLIFQAAEERAPGGAKAIVESGILSEHQVEHVLGLHVSPEIPLGQFGFRSGIMMASADELYLRVIGQGGHGAQPQRAVDPVMVTAQLLVALQQIVSRHADPRIPSVLSFGKVEAAGSTNIIPNEVYLEGTFRTTNEAWRAQALSQIQKVTQELCGAMGATADLEIKAGYPALLNEEKVVNWIKNTAAQRFGNQALLDIPIWMASEDFAYYAQQLPSAFFLVGTRNEAKGIVSDLHTPTFDLDESILERSIPLMVDTTHYILEQLAAP